MANALQLVLSNPTPGMETEFNHWYGGDHLIHGVDSLRLLETVDKEAARAGRRIDCLLQVHIASEETKFGMDAGEIRELLMATDTGRKLPNVRICGLMGMASFSHDHLLVRREFQGLKSLFDDLRSGLMSSCDYFSILSMGMSADHETAIEEGSNMVRIGSLLFGVR